MDMEKIVGSHDILFICLDTLRYDVAKSEYEKGNLPNLGKYGPWEKRHTPGNYTYAAHHAMFAGFLPSEAEPKTLEEREWLFRTRRDGVKTVKGNVPFIYKGATFVEGLEKVGYDTICIGGVLFFDNRSPVGKVLPSLFKEKYWKPSFGVTNPKSTAEQINHAIQILQKKPVDQRVFMYINICAIHGPNYFYLEKEGSDFEESKVRMSDVLGYHKDCVESQAAALRYVDQEIGRLFEAYKQRGKTFCIALSDHGTAYGEDGYNGHCISHEVVWTVPYKHFIL